MLSSGFTSRLRSVLAASRVFQIIFPGAFTISAGLLPIRRIMKNVQKILGILSSLVEQGIVLGIPDIGRSASGVHDHSATASACSRLTVRIIIVILGFSFSGLPLLCVPNDHFIDLAQHFRCQFLAKYTVRDGAKGSFSSS